MTLSEKKSLYRSIFGVVLILIAFYLLTSVVFMCHENGLCIPLVGGTGFVLMLTGIKLVFSYLEYLEGQDPTRL
ncbi:hypothetical protein FEF65_10415 [Mariprofundus erugo]|uniref:Uncharacterized protein n=2 Tax=Mariprofundus erugo TaxID=2528639 RepID=A0A5R9GJ04_9PROT|nr:hypothetical protein FEF65_10415 [Mariprofundus erugo]